MRIGITEAGDASLDYAWVKKLDDCNGAILITKNITDKFIDTVLQYKDKLIIHATCTGMGGTVIEPNVPDYMTQLAQIKKLIDKGFPENRIVVRVDPIIPTEKGLNTAQKVIDASPVKHFRFSVLDMYPHVRERFKAIGAPLPYGENFQASPEQFNNMRAWFSKQPVEYKFESCAESAHFKGLPNVTAVGCVSTNDLTKLGLSTNETFTTGLQRKTCLCLSCKTELLSNKKQCPHGCLYCYWR